MYNISSCEINRLRQGVERVLEYELPQLRYRHWVLRHVNGKTSMEFMQRLRASGCDEDFIQLCTEYVESLLLAGELYRARDGKIRNV